MCSSPLNKLMEPDTVSRVPHKREITVLLDLLAGCIPLKAAVDAVSCQGHKGALLTHFLRDQQPFRIRSCRAAPPSCWPDLVKRGFCIRPRLSVSEFPQVYKIQSKNSPHPYSLNTQQVIWCLSDVCFLSFCILPLLTPLGWGTQNSWLVLLPFPEPGTK